MLKLLIKESSAISEAYYDAFTKELLISFKSGEQFYSFPGVPHDVIWSWINSASIGKSYHQLIKPYGVSYDKVAK